MKKDRNTPRARKSNDKARTARTRCSTLPFMGPAQRKLGRSGGVGAPTKLPHRFGQVPNLRQAGDPARTCL